MGVAQITFTRMITLGLQGVRFAAGHGVDPTEAVVGGDFEVDVTVVLDAASAAEDDDLDATLDYGRLYDVCAEAMAERAELIETLAARIEAGVVALGDTRVRRVEVTVRKFHPPLGGRVGAAWVRRVEEVPAKG